MTARTLYDKIWDDHVVHEAEDGTCLLYIDRHLVHEVTSPQAFEGLRMAHRTVRAPEKTIAVPDHNVPTTLDRANAATMTEDSRIQVEALDKNARDFGINYYPVSDVRQGIVHIVGPEPVSYTHLDVYKRQSGYRPNCAHRGWGQSRFCRHPRPDRCWHCPWAAGFPFAKRRPRPAGSAGGPLAWSNSVG